MRTRPVGLLDRRKQALVLERKGGAAWRGPNRGDILAPCDFAGGRGGLPLGFLDIGLSSVPPSTLYHASPAPSWSNDPAGTAASRSSNGVIEIDLLGPANASIIRANRGVVLEILSHTSMTAPGGGSSRPSGTSTRRGLAPVLDTPSPGRSIAPAQRAIERRKVVRQPARRSCGRSESQTRCWL